MHKDEIHRLITPERLDAMARCWGVAGAEVSFIRALENFVYAFSQAGAGRILRFTHSSHRSAAEVQAELEFVDYLAHNGVGVARPIPSQQGRLIETLAVPGSEFHVAVFDRAPGDKPTFNGDPQEQAQLYEAWGAMLGRMHRVIPAYRQGQPDPRRHLGIDDDIIRHAADYLPAGSHHVIPVLHQLLDEIKTLPRRPGQFGLLHTDCHHGNFHVDGRRLTLFDFDDCCQHWFAYDIAVPVWHFPLPERGQNPARDRAALTDFLQHFIRGYSRHSIFDPSWLAQLPLFFRLRDLQLYIFDHKMQAPGALSPGHIEFRRQRCALIERRAPSVEIDWQALSLPGRG